MTPWAEVRDAQWESSKAELWKPLEGHDGPTWCFVALE